MKYLVLLCVGLALMSVNRNKISCNYQSTKVQKVLILGNSLTFHRADSSLGWRGNWGMAASAIDKDYLHLLTTDINKKKPSATVMHGTITNFEKSYWTMDYNAFLAKYKAFKPDMIILEVGENMDDKLIIQDSLSTRIVALVNYLSPNRKVPVVICSSFWPKPNYDRVTKNLCVANQWIYVPLGDLYSDPTNTSHDRFTNVAVGNHPSDKGMYIIAYRIWQKIQSYF